MQVQQDNINKPSDSSNPFLVVSTEEIRNIAQNLTEPIHANEEGFIESLNQKIHDKQNQLALIQEENTKLKSNNKQLVKQLQIFSKKLDEQLKKRAESQQRRPKITLKPQEKQSIEIQNLYKKIEIYKKQVALLKSKLYEQSDGGNRINDYENKMKLFMKENQELKDEIKSLKKVIKLQEKGLSDIGAEGFLKMTAENDKLKEQLRKLRLDMDQIERKYRTNNIQVSKPKYKTPQHINSDGIEPFFSRQGIKKELTSHKQIIANRKKNFSDYRIRTEPQVPQLNQSKTQDNESQSNVAKPYIQKIEKLENKIRSMNSQKVRQRQIIENLKIQILQKDKEVNYLRQKTESLRKLNRPKKAKQAIQSKQNIASQEQSYIQAIEEMPSRQQSKLQQYPPQEIETIPMEDHMNKPRKSQDRQSQVNGKSKQRYPRLEQVGSKKDSSYKWNHHQFSSKIKQLQIYLNNNGSVSYIHSRYEKGEPVKPSELFNRKSLSLVCQASSEYILKIKGGFRNSHLQYLVVRTNQNRIGQFGNTVIEEECENFEFSIGEHEYPSALLGENDLQGVLRFGCFVQRLPGYQ